MTLAELEREIQRALRTDLARARRLVTEYGRRGDPAMASFERAQLAHVMGVTAVDAAGRKPPFASVGGDVSLVAPGVSLLGAMPLDRSPSGTARWSGTSFAAPLVAGAAALVRDAFPALSADDVRRRLEDTAQSVDPFNPGFAGRLGDGLVPPLAALQ